MTEKNLEFWFEYGSTYTYLAVARIEPLARAAGLNVVWKPFLLFPVLQKMGIDQVSFLKYPVRGNYMWRDLERRAARHGLPYRRPEVYPPNTLLTARIGLLAAREGWCAEFTRATFHAHWTEGKIIGTPENLTPVLESLGKHPDAVIEAAGTDANKAALREQTDAAADAGIFGAPSFIVNGELFWGDDRLEEALEWEG